MTSTWLHRALRELVFLIAGLAALALLAGAALWWWSGSEGSLAWTLRRIAQYQPLRSQGVRGSLREGLHIERLQWQQDGLEVEADDVHLEWQPLTLIHRQLRLDQVQAARVRIEDRRPPSPFVPPESIEFPLRVAADQIRIGRLDWVGPNTNVTLGDLSGAYSFDGARHRLQLDGLRWAGGKYSGQATLGARRPLPLDATLQGELQANVPGGSTGVPLQFKATLQGPVTDLRAQAFLNAPTAAPSLPRATSTASVPASATASARISPWAVQPIAQAQADFHQLDLAALWPQRLPHTSLTGSLSVQPAATGTWTVAADIANALAGPWDRARLPVDHLSAEGDWRTSGQALVRNLRARLGTGELQAQGEWRGAAGWAVQGQLRRLDPSALYSALAALPLNGSADLKGEGNGIDFNVDLKAAAGKAAARRKPADGVAAAVHALELRQGRARGRWADGRLALPAFDVRTADASLRGALNLRPAARAGSGRVSLDAPGLQVHAEGELAPTTGRGNARLDIANAAQAWRWLQRLPLIPAALPDVNVGGRGEAQVAWQGGWRDPALQARIDLPLLQVRAAAPAGDTAEAASASWVVRDATASVDGRLHDASLQLRGRAEQGRRRLALELAGRGGLRSRSPDLWQATVASLNVSASDPALGTGTWTVTLQRPFDLRWASGSFDAGAGQARLTAPPTRSQVQSAPAVLAWDPVRWRTGELRTAGRLTGLPLAWLELVGGPQWAGSAFSGDMVFDAQWDASLGATPRLRATLARSGGDITVMAETTQGTAAAVRAGVRDARLTLTSDGEALTLALKWDSERGGTADGRIATQLARGGAAGWNWPATAPLDGVVRAQLPRIGVWSLLAPPGWRLRGSLAADIAIAGTRAEPRLAGTVGADDLALRSVVDGVELQGGRLRARLDGQRLVIDEFMLHGAGGANGGGTVAATGEGAWTAAGPQARLSAELTRLRASIRSDRQLTVSGHIAATIARNGTEVTGNLRVDQARIVLPDETAPRLGDDVVVRGAEGPLTKAQARTQEQGEARPGQRVKMAVDIDLGNDFRVQGHGIDTRLRGTLALSGESITAPRLSGTIRTEGGEYQAYGQRLNIERGVLRFTGPIDNPSLDILAIRPYLTQRVGVQVTGTPLTPYVRLYSEPDMADADKLSWLVLGRASANGGAEAALLQQAAVALLASRTGNGKRGVVASLGLDELSFSRSGPEGPAVTLGKRFGRNVYAAYERSLSGAMGTLQVFYDLTRSLKLRAETGERTAVDLIYTLTFN